MESREISLAREIYLATPTISLRSIWDRIYLRHPTRQHDPERGGCQPARWVSPDTSSAMGVPGYLIPGYLSPRYAL